MALSWISCRLVGFHIKVALNQLTTWALGFLVSLGVPLALSGIAFFCLRESLVAYQSCAIAIIFLAFLAPHSFLEHPRVPSSRSPPLFAFKDT